MTTWYIIKKIFSNHWKGEWHLNTIGIIAGIGQGLCFPTLSFVFTKILLALMLEKGDTLRNDVDSWCIGLVVLGAIASALVPALTLLLLLSGRRDPLVGWGTLWQWVVMIAGGAVAAPLIFTVLGWCNLALGYQPRTETSFRPDREIRRGRTTMN